MVKAKITKDGILKLYRRGNYIVMSCPFNSEEYCGDWCPLFSIYEEVRQEGDYNYNHQELRLCRRTHQIHSLEYEK